jgi:hypothetical protein
VEGKILSPVVSKVILNDRETNLDKANGAFNGDIPMISDSLDIVYKAYDPSMNLLER